MQSVQDELLNKTSKGTEIVKCMKKDIKMLKQIEDDATYFEDQTQLHRDRLGKLKTIQQEMFEILSQNQNDPL